METSVKSSSVLDKEPLMDSLAVLDTVTGSKAMLALAAIDNLLVLDTVTGPKVIDAFARIKRDAVETRVKESRAMLALPVISGTEIRGTLTRNIISHQLKGVGYKRDGLRQAVCPTSTRGNLPPLAAAQPMARNLSR